MRTTITTAGLASLALLIFSAFTLGFQTIKVQTTAVCSMCKDRIELTLGQLDGVEDVKLDLVTKKVKVKFDDSKQSEQSIKLFISKIGYGADDLAADAAAFEALPGCCKSEAACAANKAANANMSGEVGVTKAASDNAPAAEAPKKACCASKKGAKACAGKEKG